MSIYKGDIQITNLFRDGEEINQVFYGEITVFEKPTLSLAYYIGTVGDILVTLPIYPNESGVRIDWGDGTIENNVTVNNPTHIYHITVNTDPLFEVIIDGEINALNSSTITTNRNFVIGINYTKGIFSKLTTIESAFQGCMAFSQIPTAAFSGCPNLLNASKAFMSTAVTIVPDYLFKGCNKLNNISQLFNQCYSLIRIGDYAIQDLPELTTVLGCFQNNTQLRNIPVNLFSNCQKLNIFTNCFRSNPGIISSSPSPDGYKLWERAGKPGLPATVTGTACFTGCENIADRSEIPSAWGGLA